MQLGKEHIVFVVMAGVFGGLLLLEQILPLRQRKAGLRGRLLVNILLTGLAFAAGSAIVRTTAFGLAQYNQDRGWGLLGVLGLPRWLQVGVGFLLMDLTFYYWHFANHRVGVMWRFHNAHHLDPDLDVSTSFRFHCVEVGYSALFRALQVGLLGIVPLTYIVYDIAFQAATMFHHSNVRLPLRVERILNKVVVTPRMHGIHHSQMEREANSNYSVIFRGWDWLHGTLRLNVAQAAVRIGVWGYSGPGDNKFWQVIVGPFRKQRPYWQRPESNEDAGRASKELTTKMVD